MEFNQVKMVFMCVYLCGLKLFRECNLSSCIAYHDQVVSLCLWCLCRSLFGNVASLVMSDSSTGSSSSSIRDGNSTTITGVESVEGEVLQLSQPVSLVCVCMHARMSVCLCVCCVSVSLCVCV